MIPPIIIDEIILINNNVVDLVLYIKITIGAIFCHVKIIKQFDQDNPSIISGNQKWKGAAPIFVKREVFIISKDVCFILLIIIRSVDIIKIIENNRIIEAKACVIKYFKEDSEE